MDFGLHGEVGINERANVNGMVADMVMWLWRDLREKRIKSFWW